MPRKDDLEHSIHSSYDIIHEYIDIIQTSNRPEERRRAQGEIDRQWDLVDGYLVEYRPLVDNELPDEIAQIAAHFTALAEWSKVEQAISVQEGLRDVLSAEQLAAALAPLRDKQASILAQLGGVTVVGGDVIAAGGKKEVHYHAPVGPDPNELRRHYLNYLLEKAGHLVLSGIDPKAASDAEARLDLSAVYTALLTLTPAERDLLQDRGHLAEMEREVRRLSALAQLDRHGRLVLLGDPGSGKSTFCRFVAACLAGEALAHPRANLARLTEPLPQEGEEEPGPQPWSHDALLPVRVVLRDFAARGLPPVGEKATAKHLCDFIAAELDAARQGDYMPCLEQELQERGGLLLLDGLDEVPAANRRREQIRQMVMGIVEAFPKCRILVTSRTYAYQQQAWRLPGFGEAVLAPFGDGQIQRFVERWYAHIAALRGFHPDDANRRAGLLKRAISNNVRLRELAERPLLLTLMASLHAWRGGSLPEKREELYADTVDLLLDWWEGTKTIEGVQQPSLSEWLKVNRERVRGLLNELAYRVHEAQPDLVGTADVSEGDLLGGLMRLSQNPDVNLVRLVEYLSQRAGLLLPRGVGVYTFPHRTFQEYLAACYLTDHEYPDLVADLARKEPNRWREVALLAGAKSGRGTASAIWLLAEALCYRELPPAWGEGVCDEVEDEDRWGALLAAQVLVENDEMQLAWVSERNAPKRERVRRWLLAIVTRGWLPPTDRMLAGEALAVLGDGRDFDELVVVPSGPFVMGDDADSDARPAHEVTLPAFQVAKYPVTNAQYLRFVEGTGHPWRSPDAKRPQKANCPAAYVSWYDARTYCAWLTDIWRKEGRIDADEVVRLPSEAEWEKAARDPSISVGYGRRFPWGDEWDEAKCSTAELGLGSTCVVGMFPSGASPCGCLDMAGNVWEWTRSLWGKGMMEPEFKYPYDPDDGRENLDAPDDVYRVLRGGSFGYLRSDVRCSCRIGLDPHLAWSGYGFRLCVSPISLP